MSPFQAAVETELSRARLAHPGTQHSAHEGFAVLLEEVDELKAEVWKNDGRRDGFLMLKELIQVGAMAQRMAEDLGLIGREMP